MKEPSKKQLGYLKRLGYKGAAPETSGEASLLIDVMLETKDSGKAERELLADRRDDAKRKRQRRKESSKADKERIQWMLRENKAYGGDGLFAGFRFFENDDTETSEEDEEYVGAFLPLAVAAKYPDLLSRRTLDCEEVQSDDRLPAGTKMVVAPGKFKVLGSRSGCGIWMVFLVTGLGVGIVRLFV